MSLAAFHIWVIASCREWTQLPTAAAAAAPPATVCYTISRISAASSGNQSVLGNKLRPSISGYRWHICLDGCLATNAFGDYCNIYIGLTLVLFLIDSCLCLPGHQQVEKEGEDRGESVGNRDAVDESKLAKEVEDEENVRNEKDRWINWKTEEERKWKRKE